MAKKRPNKQLDFISELETATYTPPAEKMAVAQHAATEAAWKFQAVEVIRKLSEPGTPFSVEAIWDAMGGEPAEPRPMGAVLMQCLQMGLIPRAGYGTDRKGRDVNRYEGRRNG